MSYTQKTTRSRATPYARKTRLPLMNLDRKHYSFLPDREFKFLSRFAVLTKNGTQPCNYTDAQAYKEFGINERTTQRTIASLKKYNLISVGKDYHTKTHCGYLVRTITLTTPVVVYRKEAKNA